MTGSSRVQSNCRSAYTAAPRRLRKCELCRKLFDLAMAGFQRGRRTADGVPVLLVATAWDRFQCPDCRTCDPVIRPEKAW